MNSALVIDPAKLSGTLFAPPSKSVAHRAIIAAALAKGTSRISNVELSQDIEATVGAVVALGAKVDVRPKAGGRAEVQVEGITGEADCPIIDCRESGSTLRFLLPVAVAAAGGAVFTGSGRLGQRPLGPYLELFAGQGISVEQGISGFPLTVRGALKPGRFVVPGNVSSQFITGLLLALPLLDGPSDIEVVGVLESLPYVDITIDVLARFGIDVKETERGRLYHVVPGHYQPQTIAVEGDWSQAAFLLLMGLVGGPVSVGGLNDHSRQGDIAILDVFRAMGGSIQWSEGLLVASPSKLTATAVDVSQCPDLTPAIAAAMAVADGESRITGGRRLRDKESDRLKTIAACLSALGADIAETDDGLIIHGKAALQGGTAQSFNDHRIAMMAAAVSAACAKQVTLEGFNAVEKSWPGFWEDFKGLGGDIHEQSMG